MGIPGAKGTLAEQLPEAFADVEWVGERFPGAPEVSGIEGGANCQQYAYTVLAQFGLQVPPLRSSELWTDARLHTVTGDEQALDLVLYAPTSDPYGAHVGVVVGDDAILHLCAELNHPAVWSERDFAQREHYGCRIGARRLTQ
jgi:cell wall-associated NlpC family hydrolase